MSRRDILPQVPELPPFRRGSGELIHSVEQRISVVRAAGSNTEAGAHVSEPETAAELRRETTTAQQAARMMVGTPAESGRLESTVPVFTPEIDYASRRTAGSTAVLGVAGVSTADSATKTTEAPTILSEDSADSDNPSYLAAIEGPLNTADETDRLMLGARHLIASIHGSDGVPVYTEYPAVAEQEDYRAAA